MATLLDVEAEVPPTAPPEPKSKKAPTAAFKVIPETRPLRDRIREAAAAYVRPLDKAKPLTRDEFRAIPKPSSNSWASASSTSASRW